MSIAQCSARRNISFKFSRCSLLPALPLSFMPLITSSSGFQINGGNFYDVAGDMNIHGTHSAIGLGSDPLTALESGLDASTRRLVGPQRNGRQTGAARMAPYGLAGRPPLLGRSYESYRPPPPSALIPSLVGSPPLHPERGAIEYFSVYDQDRGWFPENDRNRADPLPAPIHPGRFEYSSTHNQIHGGLPEGNVPSFSAQDPRTHINIGGNVNQIHGERGFHILHRAAAADAFHDSVERFPQPRCHPETRTEMLEDLWEWSSNTDPSTSVFWLHGPAGAGKSAIAQSFCQELEAENCLGASFFFKRGHISRGFGNKLFPTVACQLALHQPELKTAISRIVEEDPFIANRAFSTQLRRLIIEPCRETISNRTLVIVIDGLDECEGQNIQEEILRSIGSTIAGPLPLRFFIASRPEPHIRETFTSALQGIHCSMNIEQSFNDVRKYLLDEFARIHEQHKTMANIPFPWPASNNLEYLVRRSSGYFIYASTVIKFIDDKDFRPTERLNVIMGIKEADDESPFAALDQLYRQILSQSRARPRLLQVLTVVAAKFDWPIGSIEQLFGLEPGDVRLTLRGLHSVIGAKDYYVKDIWWGLKQLEGSAWER
ncbi:NACHT domain-containing protein [Mycena sanguinolenta]|uniref:NACHT domain-containing protein n=1 Tax=Mycena sanguinolenta TaxID=230812 RepID=A0A8H6ZII2_9AGAR|nr:NACHT domain-containing protein [Mycena sanguinolenta]